MAAIATRLSDKVILTSDNPRNENPETIIEEMRVGVPLKISKNFGHHQSKRSNYDSLFIGTQGRYSINSRKGS